MGKILGEEVLDEQGASDNRQHQQHDSGPDPDHFKQQGFHGLKWWQVAYQNAVVVVLELAVLKIQQNGLDGGQRKQAVRCHG